MPRKPLRQALADPNFRPNSNVSQIPYGGAIPSAGIPAMQAPDVRRTGSRLAPAPLESDQGVGFLRNSAGGYQRAVPTVSLQQAIADPNYNKDGRYFGGAGLTINHRGAPGFVDRTQRTPASGRPREEILREMTQKKLGYVDDKGTFYGRSTNYKAPTLSEKLQNPVLQDRAARADKAREMITARAKQGAEARRLRMGEDLSLSERLTMANPALAMRGQLAQDQFASQERIARIGAEGVAGAAKSKADAEAAGYRAAERAAYIAAGKPVPQHLQEQSGGLAGKLATPPGAAVPAEKPVFLSGRASQDQMAQLEELRDDPNAVRDYMRNGLGMKDEEIGPALDKFYGGMLRGRSASTPGYGGTMWNNYQRGLGGSAFREFGKSLKPGGWASWLLGAPPLVEPSR